MPTSYTPPESAQGSAVSYGGIFFTKLTKWQLQSGNVNVFDNTAMSATVVGTGAATRTLRRKDPVSVEPTTYAASFLGVKTFTLADRGKVAVLSITFQNGAFSAPAILMDFNVEGVVNEFIVTSATFMFTQA